MQRRRAPRACLQCRQRKIKCDFSNTGIPCSSCLRLDTPCAVNHARKSRKAAAQDGQKLPLSSVFTFEVRPLEENTTINELLHTSAMVNHHLGTEAQTTSSGATNLPPLEPFTTDSNFMSPPQLITLPEGGARLPPYITPVRQGVEPEMLHLLYRRGALSTPQGEFRECLLRAYVCYVHPFLPLLDLGVFLSTVYNEDSSKTVSLILFQAVMFAASTFADMKDLEKQGFKSHEEARRIFFLKVRVSCCIDEPFLSSGILIVPPRSYMIRTSRQIRWL